MRIFWTQRKRKFGTTKTTPIHNNTNQQQALEELKEEEEDPIDDYPLFTPHHRSLLSKHLTPTIWNRIKHLITPTFHVTIEDIIRSGTSLPHGYHPPRGIGILAGDADSYNTFAPLFDEIIRDYHDVPDLISCDEFHYQTPHHNNNNNNKKKESLLLLQRHQTDINPNHILTTNNNQNIIDPDPDGSYILSTRVRVSRSIVGYPFPSKMNRYQRRCVQRLIRDSLDGAFDVSENRIIRTSNHHHHHDDHHHDGYHGLYIPLLSMTNADISDLIRRNILFDMPDEWAIQSNLANDYPDGRAIYVNVNRNLDEEIPDVILWINEEDHVRVTCTRKGGNVRGVFGTVYEKVRDMELALLMLVGEDDHHDHHHHDVKKGKKRRMFVHDERLGYLNSCPSNVGTAMRASMHCKLIRLGRKPGFQDLVRRMKLVARGTHHSSSSSSVGQQHQQQWNGVGENSTTGGRYTGVFDISNAERFGKSEVELINILVKGVAKLIELEEVGTW